MAEQLEFREAVVRSIDLLITLPKWAPRLEEARTTFAGMRVEHPGVEMELLSHVDPQKSSVDYDVLLEHPSGGTVTVSFTPDDAIPWSVLQADHWALNLIATINGQHVTFQQALAMLRQDGGEHGFPDALVEAALLREALAEEPPAISTQELQATADAFRRAHGLTTAASTRAWMQRRGLTIDTFDELLRERLLTHTLAERVAGAGVERYFEEHQAQFAAALIARATTSDPRVADRLVTNAVRDGADLLSAGRTLAAGGEDIRLFLGACRREELATALADAVFGAAPNQIVGPILDGRAQDVIQVLEHRPARLDPATRRSIRDLLFREWLAGKRAEATIIWHWMV